MLLFLKFVILLHNVMLCKDIVFFVKKKKYFIIKNKIYQKQMMQLITQTLTHLMLNAEVNAYKITRVIIY